MAEASASAIQAWRSAAAVGHVRKPAPSHKPNFCSTAASPLRAKPAEERASLKANAPERSRSSRPSDSTKTQLRHLRPTAAALRSDGATEEQQRELQPDSVPGSSQAGQQNSSISPSRPAAATADWASGSEEEETGGSLGAGGPRSSIDRIEIQAKASLAKLKHLLYKLKTRPEGEIRSTLLSSPSPFSSSSSSASTGTVKEDEKEVFVSQKIEVDLSSSRTFGGERGGDGTEEAIGGEGAGDAEETNAVLISLESSGGGDTKSASGQTAVRFEGSLGIVDGGVVVATPASSPLPILSQGAGEEEEEEEEKEEAGRGGGTGPGLSSEAQLDALTCTRTTVTFDEASQTATVTVTATVRAAEVADERQYSERAIAMAARALARTCLMLDEKAQAAVSAAAAAGLGGVGLPAPSAWGQSLSTSEGRGGGRSAAAGALEGAAAAAASAAAGSDRASGRHKQVLRDLLLGRVARWELAGPEFGCTPFRPVFAVTLQVPSADDPTVADLEGSSSSSGSGKQQGVREVDALFKPTLPGDRLLRWKRAPPDWIAYELSGLLGMDIVPPAVLRNAVRIGPREYSSGVMVLRPPALSRLEDVDPTAVTCQPATVVSDVRVLDTLLGNAVRDSNAFWATAQHWSHHHHHHLHLVHQPAAVARAPAEGNRKQHTGAAGEGASGVGEGNAADTQDIASSRPESKLSPAAFPVVMGHPVGPALGEAMHSMWTSSGARMWTPGPKVVSSSTYSRLQQLSKTSLLEGLGGALSEAEMDAIQVKRDMVLAYFEFQFKSRGREKALM